MTIHKEKFPFSTEKRIMAKIKYFLQISIFKVLNILNAKIVKNSKSEPKNSHACVPLSVA
jgi:hypothetical protein